MDILVVERQKGVKTIYQCFMENQKGGNTVHKVYNGDRTLQASSPQRNIVGQH